MTHAPISANGRLLSIADIARHFSLPESTARYYCKRFARYMPVSGEGRRRRYRREALDVIRAVLDAMRETKTATGVENVLAGAFPHNAVSLIVPADEAPPAETLPAMPVPAMPAHIPAQLFEQQCRALEGIASSLAILVQRQEELAELAFRAQAAQREREELRDELSRLRMLLNSSEKVHQDDMAQMRKWLTLIARERAAPPAP
jgi:DNA-binding transcriptional MerR regulator